MRGNELNDTRRDRLTQLFETQIARFASPKDQLDETPGRARKPRYGTRLGADYSRELILRNAVALLSGPGGLASRLRTSRLSGPAASISLPLDVGAATDTIPPHLRRAVILRDVHCGFPGCTDTNCQVHHINADSTKTAISPDGKRILRSHDPPKVT
jgi:hypothetical protein